MGDQRNLENSSRKVWGQRSMGTEYGAEPVAGQPEMHRETLVAGRLGLPPNGASPEHFSSNTWRDGCTYRTIHANGVKYMYVLQTEMHGI